MDLESAFQLVSEAPHSQRRELARELVRGEPARFNELLSLLVAHEELEEEESCARAEGARLRENATFGRYTLLQRVGKGGSSEVWRATNGTGSHIALKVITDRDRLNSFGELQALRRLRMGTQMARLVLLPQLLEYGELWHGGPHFIALDFVEGRTLRNSDSGLRSRVRAIVHAAGALRIMHHVGLVHADLKPSNVMENGHLLDLGLARRWRRREEVAALRAAPPLAGGLLTGPQDTWTTATIVDPRTLTGVIAGTPSFMAPEQALGLGVGGVTDVYGLSATLYYAVTGSAPHDGLASNSLDLINRLRALEQPMPVLARSSRVAEALAHVLEEGLLVNPRERLRSVDDFCAVLVTFAAREMSDVLRLREGEPGSIALAAALACGREAHHQLGRPFDVPNGVINRCLDHLSDRLSGNADTTGIRRPVLQDPFEGRLAKMIGEEEGTDGWSYVDDVVRASRTPLRVRRFELPPVDNAAALRAARDSADGLVHMLLVGTIGGLFLMLIWMLVNYEPPTPMTLPDDSVEWNDW